MNYFGTDGIRGIYGKKITVELAYKVGVAISKVLDNDTLVVGMDTRISSFDLAKACMSGFLGNIIFAGEVPTPVIAHYSKENNIIGVMITASHNPYEYNGIKVFNKGYKLSKEEELKIEEEIAKIIEIGEISDFGVVSVDVFETYEKVFAKIPKTNLIQIALDTANGAAHKLGPTILNDYTKEILQIGYDPDGLNINLDCGSTNISFLEAFMTYHDLNLGFSFDGDADRVLVLEEGFLIDGDLIVYILANYLKKHNKLKENTVVLTKMSNPGLLEALDEIDIKYILTDVGDKYIQEVLDKKGLSLGGEPSGHIILPDYIPTGDGILVAAMLLSIIGEEEKALSELSDDVKLYPFILKNLKDINKDVLEKSDVKLKLDEIRNKLPKNSLMLVRASGTEPLIRVTLSLKDEKLLKEYLKEIVEILKVGE